MTIGKKLQQRRKELNLTQGEVAKRLYVSRQAISNWELDKNYPDLETVIALSDLYQLSLDVLLKEDQHVVKGIEKTMNRKIIGTIFYGITAVSGLICLLVNFIVNHTLTWSLIVLLALGSMDALSHIYRKRTRWSPRVLMGTSSVVCISFTGLMDQVLLWSGYTATSFFLSVALPLSLLWLGLIWLTAGIQRRMNWEVCYSLSLFFLLGIVGGGLTNWWVRSEPLWFSAITTTLPCLFLAGLFYILGNHLTKTSK
ncbi:hypothetical protein NRIC_20550 [Enterococcus florum]|uniref:HTH cro/C1-type domain-containing protein n=1 Tax=Enterococcus florum TaxID=2480627 RepID=A0A4P5PCE4_9ENTE|nr:helix-turn-helix domain-containing protein [Enterococcus florum]GCF94164.1 hypothetical protein NRIC_20550 [Enterococcus florum]